MKWRTFLLHVIGFVVHRTKPSDLLVLLYVVDRHTFYWTTKLCNSNSLRQRSGAGFVSCLFLKGGETLWIWGVL